MMQRSTEKVDLTKEKEKLKNSFHVMRKCNKGSPANSQNNTKIKKRRKSKLSSSKLRLAKFDLRRYP